MSPSSREPHAGVLPEHESFRRAIRWLSLRRQEEPQADLRRLIGDAARQFDLSPAEEVALLHLIFSGAEDGSSP